MTPSPFQRPSPSHPPHQVAPREVPEKSDGARSTDSEFVGGLRGWPTPSTRQDAVGSKLSSQAGGPGPARIESEAAGKPPTSIASVSDSASRPALSGVHTRGSSLAAPPMPGSRERDLALAGGNPSSAGQYPRGASASSGHDETRSPAPLSALPGIEFLPGHDLSRAPRRGLLELQDTGARAPRRQRPRGARRMTPAQRELARLLALMLAAEVRKSAEAQAHQAATVGTRRGSAR